MAPHIEPQKDSSLSPDIELTKSQQNFASVTEKGVSLAFKDISFSVPEKSRIFGLQAKDEKGRPKTKEILSNVSGFIPPGKCCAILGSSGSGKTSLLDVLSGNITAGKISGQILFGGNSFTPSMLRNHCGYVMQDDSHLPELTVLETLTYAAKLRLSASLSPEQKRDVIKAIIVMLGLQHVEGSKVGGGFVRGISGGERRRVSIGVQLLNDPEILLLDEPTTGLDAFTANNIIKLLSLLASKNKTVIFTIHQPRSDIFPLLDLVMFLSMGRSVYFGPREQLLDHFSGIGYPCDRYANPLDHYIDVVTVDKRSNARLLGTLQRLDQMVKGFQDSQINAQLLSNIEAEIQNRGDRKQMKIRNRPNTFSLGYTITHRMCLNLFRSNKAVYNRTVQLLFFAFILWMFIYHFGDDQTSIQNRSGFLYESVVVPIFMGGLNSLTLFPELRNLYYRESRENLYSSPILIFGYFLSILPTTIISAFLYSAFSYWATGFYPEAARYFVFTGVVILISLFGEFAAVSFLGLFYDITRATGSLNLILSLSALTGSGFLRSYGTIPKPILRLGYASIHRYAAELLFSNEFHKLELSCTPGNPCPYPTGDDYLDRFYPDALEHFARDFAVLAGFNGCIVLLSAIIFAVIRPKLR